MEMYYVREHTPTCRFLKITISFYIFTFLIFRKQNKPQLKKNKQQNCIGIRAFDSRFI
jgi:preprotein translocase subunit YajC